MATKSPYCTLVTTMQLHSMGSRVSCSNSDDEQEPEDDAGSPSDLQNQSLNEDDANADEPPIEDGMHLPCSSMS